MLPNREIDHKTKSVKTTKKFDKIELVYYEACLSKKDSLLRERQLKTGFGRGYIKRRIKNYLNNKRE
jgi:putative endonuclease